MLHGAAVGLLAALAADAAAGAARALGRPTRWLHAAAIVAALALPPLLVLGPVPGTAVTQASASLVDADRVLAWLWLLGSMASLLTLAVADVRLGRLRHQWKATLLDGVPVLRSATAGPAVVGFLRPEIVLPAWAFDLEERERALVLVHEEEHRRSGDARLMGAALLAVALAPWQPALWWQLHRLRTAVELDCDARIAAPGATGDYRTIVREVVARETGRLKLPMAALSAPIGLLDARLGALASDRPRSSPLVTAAYLALAVSAAAAIGMLPRPEARAPGFSLFRARVVLPDDSLPGAERRN
jgi:bla regulator protein BlaR1